jgi:hypothetical protein
VFLASSSHLALAVFGASDVKLARASAAARTNK